MVVRQAKKLAYHEESGRVFNENAVHRVKKTAEENFRRQKHGKHREIKSPITLMQGYEEYQIVGELV